MDDSIVEIRCNDTLVLVPQLAVHAEALFQILQPKEIYAFLDNEAPTDFASFEARLKRLETRCSPDGDEQWLNWVVCLKGETAGYVQATVYPDSTCEIAYVLNPIFWGQGIATLATEAMMKFIVENYGVIAFFAEIDAQNVGSIGLVQRLGFEQVPHDAVEVKFVKLVNAG
ncbi:GNAT family N-acetyltransferase [Maritalea sp.]|uniref:GNAT family N-acetyltransferase n=1 Tax=Maritalea sp. TaxID=2003361 RepID=UPI003EF267AD